MKLIEIVPAHSLEHKREIRRMAADVMPKDDTWAMLAVCAACMAFAVFAVVRWWTCV